MKRLWIIVVMLSVCLALGTSALAKNDHADKHGKDRDHVIRHDRDGDHDRDRHEHKAHAREHRDNDDKRKGFTAKHDRRPPGWDHGRKVGWGGCNVPPGQAKKVGCQDQGHRHEAHTRPVIVRRPIVRRPTARVTAGGRATATVN